MLKEARHWHQPINRRLHAYCASSHNDKDPRLRVAGLRVAPFQELDLLTPHLVHEYVFH